MESFFVKLLDNFATLRFNVLIPLWSKLLVPLWLKLLAPLFVLTAYFLVAVACYVVLAYVNVIVMLLRELIIANGAVVTVPSTEEESITREEPMKLATLIEVRERVQPLSVAELRKLGQAAGIKGARTMKKAELLTLLDIKE